MGRRTTRGPGRWSTVDVSSGACRLDGFVFYARFFFFSLSSMVASGSLPYSVTVLHIGWLGSAGSCAQPATAASAADVDYIHVWAARPTLCRLVCSCICSYNTLCYMLDVSSGCIHDGRVGIMMVFSGA